MSIATLGIELAKNSRAWTEYRRAALPPEAVLAGRIGHVHGQLHEEPGLDARISTGRPKAQTSMRPR